MPTMSGCDRRSVHHQVVPAFWTPIPMKSGGPIVQPSGTSGYGGPDRSRGAPPGVPRRPFLGAELGRRIRLARRRRDSITAGQRPATGTPGPTRTMAAVCHARLLDRLFDRPRSDRPSTVQRNEAKRLPIAEATAWPPDATVPRPRRARPATGLVTRLSARPTEPVAVSCSPAARR